MESLRVFWISAVAADGDVGKVLSRYAGTVLAARCHHAWGPNHV